MRIGGIAWCEAIGSSFDRSIEHAIFLALLSFQEVLMGDRSSLAHHFGSSRMVSCRDTENGELTAVTEEVTGYGPAVDPMFGLT
ncbi:hypothetical protein B296_00024595 [Ensete ventricosum]|uniref:Uncharacterized protein n=1 Tax=Ensete ventricosum TaxID=4639 RepID=A0A426XRC6_ENSVE|nr:hypothetical protein B296_00024595 [Ensete ventricosum]